MRFQFAIGKAVCVVCFGLSQAAQAVPYDLAFTGLVTATNACTYPSTIDCYAPLGTTISGSFRYTTGSPGLVSPTQDFYKNLITDFSLNIAAVGYTGSYHSADGFGRFVVSRDSANQSTASSSTFSTYVARDAGNYTFLGGTNTAAFAPRISTAAAVPSDNIYGDLAISAIQLNFGALTALFADLAVPTTFSYADLSPAVTNFGIALTSDYYLGNAALYSFGGGLTSVTVTPVAEGGGSTSSVPEPGTYSMLLAGLGVLAAIAHRRRQKPAV